MGAYLNMLLFLVMASYMVAGHTLLDKIKDDPDLSQVR